MTGFGSVFARDDTLLGACHGLGEDFGFDPAWLRILFAVGLFLSPAVAAAAYAACVAIVAAMRWLVPEPMTSEAGNAPANDDERQAQAWEELALAA